MDKLDSGTAESIPSKPHDPLVTQRLIKDAMNRHFTSSIFPAVRILFKAGILVYLGLFMIYSQASPINQLILLNLGYLLFGLGLTSMYFIGCDCRRRIFLPAGLEHVNSFLSTAFHPYSIMFYSIVLSSCNLVLDYKYKAYYISALLVSLGTIYVFRVYIRRRKEFLDLIKESAAVLIVPEIRQICEYIDSKIQLPNSLYGELVSLPLYNLNGFYKELVEILGGMDCTPCARATEATEANTETDRRYSRLINPVPPPDTSLMFTILTPMRSLVREVLLWETRDISLYVAFLIFHALVLAGYTPITWLSFLIMIPFLGPKSSAARSVRKMQRKLPDDDITVELKQGRAQRRAGMSFLRYCLRVANWPMVVYIGGVNLLALYAIYRMMTDPTIKPKTIVFAFLLWPITGLGITAGVHRLWAHRSYTANTPYRVFVMLLNSIANQGSIFHWARDHRVHHKFSDTIADPYDSTRGLLYSHMGWLLIHKSEEVVHQGKSLNMDDLKADPVVMFQKNCDPWWNLLWCFVFPACVSMMWGERFWVGVLIPGVFRYVFVLHCTWSVNSLVHAFGPRPYDPNQVATENEFVSILAIGEGWHSWHHAYPFDYAASELGVLEQFNPTKLFIDFFANIGWVTKRKRYLDHWEKKVERWVEEKTEETGIQHEAHFKKTGLPFFRVRVLEIKPVPEKSVPEPAAPPAVET